jgi:uncharacterized protein (TIGR00251 family)
MVAQSSPRHRSDIAVSDHCLIDRVSVFCLLMAQTKPEFPWILQVRAVPNASKSSIEGWHERALRIKLRAVPEDGKANKELIRLLSDLSGLPKKCFEVAVGAQARNKQIRITGMDRVQFMRAIGMDCEG